MIKSITYPTRVERIQRVDPDDGTDEIFHPVSNLFPAMSETEFADLKADIKAHGQREPIWRYRGQIIDGRHRYQACEELGYMPVYREYKGEDGDQALLAFVISLNLKRRHLSESQRAMVAAKLANMPHGGAMYRSANWHFDSLSQSTAGNLLNVSTRAVRRAVKVKSKGVVPLQIAVESGKVAVSTAAIIADTPKSEQTAIVSRTEKEIIARAKEIKERKKQERVVESKKKLEIAAASFNLEYVAVRDIAIFNKDSRTLASFVSPDVDLVFTSPPYNVGMKYEAHDDAMPDAAYTALLRDVFTQCFLVMRLGARIGVNVPFGVNRDPYLPCAPRIFSMLAECGFTLIGQTVWDKGPQKTGASTAWGSYGSPRAPRFRDRCEVIVWAYKNIPSLEIPDGANVLIDGDTFRLLSQDYWLVAPVSSKNHPAIFPVALAENAIRFFGYAGCHVLDPFAGLGNSGQAAQDLNCRATLVDIDPAYCALMQSRFDDK